MKPAEQEVEVCGLRLSVREWDGAERPFLLVHGLASNARTWDGLARQLHAAGHRVVAFDQRGHGRSDKPPQGYGFDQVTADLSALVKALSLSRPVVVGQSWGGNVALEFAARYPAALSGLVFVDGGFLELSARPGMTWERAAVELRPPDFAGTPRPAMAERLRAAHPDWSDEAIENSLANFETLADGSVRPWLTLDRHMQILRALWEHKPSLRYAELQAPTLIAAVGGSDEEPGGKRHQVAQAESGIPRVLVQWFQDSAHDLHVQRPKELAAFVLQAVRDQFFF